VKLLLLAGTGEARALAERLARDARVEVLASLAGVTRAPQELAVPFRIGGFGGDAGQEKFMRDEGIEAVVDATHPFAAQISTRTEAICARLGLPYLQLLRPGWTPGPDDRWHFVDREEDVAAALPEGAVVFLATGPKRLERFTGLAAHRVYCRRIDPAEAPFPLPRGDWVIGRPPFSVAGEIALFQRLGIGALVVKDAGGTADAKLRAARDLGLPVVLIRRPPPPPGDKAATVEAALDWLERLL
jgi:precorrin-6A/cobalt-precorrin-6A reductase